MYIQNIITLLNGGLIFRSKIFVFVRKFHYYEMHRVQYTYFLFPNYAISEFDVYVPVCL